MNSRLINYSKQFEHQQNYYRNAEELEAKVSSSHAVSQFVLVPEERHEAHVSLDEHGLIQDQDAIGLPGNRLHGVDFLRRVPELLAKVLDLRTSGWEDPKCITKHIYSQLCDFSPRLGRGTREVIISDVRGINRI